MCELASNPDNYFYYGFSRNILVIVRLVLYEIGDVLTTESNTSLIYLKSCAKARAPK